MSRSSVVALLGLLVVALLFGLRSCHDRIPAAVSAAAPTRIARAGGGLDGLTDLNSLAALDHNYRLGFRLFEIDLTEDADGNLVCVHDWQDFFSAAGREQAVLPGAEEFERLRRDIPERYRPCSLGELAEWLAAHQDAVLVSDFREEPERGLTELARVAKDAGIAVIPQIYQPAQYDLALRLGFRRMIWTLHDFTGSQQHVLRIAETIQPFAVTMPPGRAVTPVGSRSDGTPVYLPWLLGKIGIPTYVHTINEPEEVELLKDVYGVTDVYTDFLAPPVDTAP